MKFLKYLIFVFFLFSVTPAFADYYTLPGFSQEFSTLDSACKHWRDNEGYKGWDYRAVDDTCYFFIGDFNGYRKELKPTKVESCPGLARTKPIYINGWTNWSPDQMDDYLKKVSPTICSQGCRFKDPALIGSSIAGDNQDMMQVSYANGVKDSSCPSTDDPGYPPNPDGSPGGPPPSSCQGDYCKKPPEGCPENYKEGMFNDEQYCFKPIDPNEPSASEPTDPNEPSASEPNGGGDGKGNCNGTNNCNTNTLEVDVKKIVDAIAQSAQSIVSSINGAVKSISDVIKTTSDNIVNSVKNVETEVKETNKKLDQTNEKLDYSNKKLDALESSASTANAHLDALEKSASQANGHLDALEKSASEANGHLDALEKSASEVQGWLTKAPPEHVETQIPVREIGQQSFVTNIFKVNAGYCPADKHISWKTHFGLVEKTFSFADVCQNSAWFGYIVMLISYLWAVHIVMRA